jgi:uncharacterized protein (DUF2252 family)
MSAEASTRILVHKTAAERAAAGKAARAQTPLNEHARFDASWSRDPVGLLLKQADNRVRELVPVRHGRMLVSPFTFYRGAALPMAADLAKSPSSGLRVQLCGDAHLANFGAFASPERRLVFDVNDFDETLPGPFEWDVKRLVTSLVVASRDNGFSKKDGRKIALAGAAAYRNTMRSFAKLPVMAVWYAHLDVEDAMSDIRAQIPTKRFKAVQKMMAKAHTRDSMQALKKLTSLVDGERRFVADPPLIVPLEDLFAEVDQTVLYERLHEVVRNYRRTLQPDRRHLLEQFELRRVARKVVGVGSVGTRAWVLLLEAGDGMDPLLLQGKEAQKSVLADYCGASRYRNQGERVVAGQHLMQAASDIFLGWEKFTSFDGVQRDFYLRQLRDWKLSFPIEAMLPAGMALYAGLCAWTLARAHARSGDRVAIASYLGGSDAFDKAIADFAELYADQNERDYAALKEAVASGRVEAASNL